MDIVASENTVYWYVRGPGFIHMGFTEPGQVTSTKDDIPNGDEDTVAESIAQYEDELPYSKRKLRKEAIKEAKKTASQEELHALEVEEFNLQDEEDMETGFQRVLGRLKFHKPKK